MSRRGTRRRRLLVAAAAATAARSDREPSATRGGRMKGIVGLRWADAPHRRTRSSDAAPIGLGLAIALSPLRSPGLCRRENESSRAGPASRRSMLGHRSRPARLFAAPLHGKRYHCGVSSRRRRHSLQRQHRSNRPLAPSADPGPQQALRRFCNRGKAALSSQTPHGHHGASHSQPCALPLPTGTARAGASRLRRRAPLPFHAASPGGRDGVTSGFLGGCTTLAAATRVLVLVPCGARGLLNGAPLTERPADLEVSLESCERTISISCPRNNVGVGLFAPSGGWHPLERGRQCGCVAARRDGPPPGFTGGSWLDRRDRGRHREAWR